MKTEILTFQFVFCLFFYLPGVHLQQPCFDLTTLSEHDYHEIQQLELLKHTCPDYASDEAPVQLCCSEDQLSLISNTFFVYFLERIGCTHCIQNLRNIICNISCNPNNNAIFHLNRLNVNDVQIPEIYVQSEWLKKLVTSCKDYVLPVFGDSTYSTFILDRTTGRERLQDHILNMLKMIYGAHDAEITVMDTLEPAFYFNQTIIDCDSVYSFGDHIVEKCGCRDCSAVCSDLFEPLLLEDILKSKLKLTVWLGIIGGFCFIFFLFITIFIIIWRRLKIKNAAYDVYQNNDSNDHSLQKNGISSATKLKYSNVSKQAQTAVKNTFRKIGDFLIKYSKIFIIFGALISFCFSLAIIFTFKLKRSDRESIMKSDSKVLEHEKIFNSYDHDKTRKVVIFIQNTKDEYFTYKYLNQEYLINNILSLSILNDVDEILEDIDELKLEQEEGGNTYTFDHFCVKVAEDCFTLSVLNYVADFDIYVQNQDNKYLNKIISCARMYAPLPVEKDDQIGDENLFSFESEKGMERCQSGESPLTHPNYVFGKNYTNSILESDTLVITLLLRKNNEAIDNYSTLVEEWEKLLETYLSKLNIKNLKVTYYTEKMQADFKASMQTENMLFHIIAYSFIACYWIVFAGNIDIKRGNKQILCGFSLNILSLTIYVVSLTASIGFISVIKNEILDLSLELLIFLSLLYSFTSIIHFSKEFWNLIKTQTQKEEDSLSCMPRVFEIMGPIMISRMVMILLACLPAFTFRLPLINDFILLTTITVTMFTFLVLIVYFPIASMYYSFLLRADVTVETNTATETDTKDTNVMEILFYKFYAFVLSLEHIKILIMFVFVTIFATSIYATTKLPMGINISRIYPDHMLVKFLNESYRSMYLGPPVYFFIDQNYEYSSDKNFKKICSAIDCDEDSLAQRLIHESRDSNISMIMGLPTVWVDAYLQWLLAENMECCEYAVAMENGDPLPTDEYIYCTDENYELYQCMDCIEHKTELFYENSRELFQKHIHHFLNSEPTKDCPYGGKLLIDVPINLLGEEIITPDVLISQEVVLSSAILSYHVPLLTINDFLTAKQNAETIAKELTRKLNHPVFAYSSFYPDYDIYSDLKEKYWFYVLIVIILNAFILSFAYYLNFFHLLITISSVFIFIFPQNALMFMYNIELNPISLAAFIVTLATGLDLITMMPIGVIYHSSISNQVDYYRICADYAFMIIRGNIVMSTIRVLLGLFSSNKISRVYMFPTYYISTLCALMSALVFVPTLIGIKFQRRQLQATNI